MGRDYGQVEDIKPYGVIVWREASSSEDGGWKVGDFCYDAIELPGLAMYPLNVGDLVPIYLHAGKYFYGPACGP